MTPNEYVDLALITESKPSPEMKERITDNLLRLNHAANGLVTESAEFIDVIKGHIYYGKPIDRVNLAEEIGDIMWYIAIACDALDVPLEDIMTTNIAKLKNRYGDKFTAFAAINRDLKTERETLEK